MIVLKDGEKMTVGKRIKEIRILKGWTQKTLAEKSNMAEITIRQYENDSRKPKTENLQKIALSFGVSINELLVISTEATKQSLTKTTAFRNYLNSLGYEIHESPYNDKWEISIKELEQDIFISDEEMNILESTAKENIDLRITKYISDGKHKQ
jgi:transcriptional regulator with XRE-family HTH domain